MKWLILYYCLCCLIITLEGGHEVLYKFESNRKEDLQPEQLAIVQFDSRSLSSAKTYWHVSIHWNAQFCRKHDHKYFFLSLRKPNTCSIIKGDFKVSLADPWCKVKAMSFFNDFIFKQPNTTIKAVLFMDSDAVISLNANYSMTTAINFIQQTSNWSVAEKPVAFNQDGPGWSCKNALKRGYRLCLNSGTVLWFKSATSTNILNAWWRSAADPYHHEVDWHSDNASDACSLANTDKWPPKLRHFLYFFHIPYRDDLLHQMAASLAVGAG